MITGELKNKVDKLWEMCRRDVKLDAPVLSVIGIIRNTEKECDGFYVPVTRIITRVMVS